MNHKITFSIYAVLLPTLIIADGIVYWRNHESLVAERTRQYERACASIDEGIGYLEQDMLEIATYFSINFEIQQALAPERAKTEQDPLFWQCRQAIG